MYFPNYFLPQPSASWDTDTTTSFERLLDGCMSQGGSQGGGAAAAEIPYTLAAPKWQFLSYVCASKNIVLHGSGNPAIGEFEPRKADDLAEFGNRRAVYATSDGIWAMYFAIVDRDKHVSSLINACFRVVTDVVTESVTSPPYYYFSINGDALPHHPWRVGTVYLLPCDSFELQPRLKYRDRQIEVAQWASAVAVKPLAKLRVGPEDFPFLDRIIAHDPAVIRERAQANPDGFPWQDE